MVKVLTFIGQVTVAMDNQSIFTNYSNYNLVTKTPVFQDKLSIWYRAILLQIGMVRGISTMQ